MLKKILLHNLMVKGEEIKNYYIDGYNIKIKTHRYKSMSEC